MATSTLFASSRRASYGLLVAAGILFLATVGGSGALYNAYTGAVAENAILAVHAPI